MSVFYGLVRRFGVILNFIREVSVEGSWDFNRGSLCKVDYWKVSSWGEVVVRDMRILYYEKCYEIFLVRVFVGFRFRIDIVYNSVRYVRIFLF